MRIEASRILDDKGRTLILRGCNLGGNCKLPYAPNGATWRPDSLRNAETVSFVGRPFPLEDADDHFARLARWGFLFLRLIVTWEAIEHAGPGLYDEAYLAYIRKILKKAEDYEIQVFIDPHQDVWSRWTGGDGAPLWTLEKVGMDHTKLYATGAAVTNQEYGSPFPRMCWPTNYSRYAAATMFSLFFAGNRYAPETKIDGESAQDWLQARYLAAMRHAFKRWKDCRAIVGWGTMNEPHTGFIGYQNLNGLENCPVETGPIPNAFQAMAAASGFPVEVPVYATGLTGVRVKDRLTINSDGVKLFKDGCDCPWKRAGVWEIAADGKPTLKKPGHFREYDGRPAVFVDDFLKPFQKRFAAAIREVRPDALIFIEGVPHEDHPRWSAEDGEGFVNAFHCYDGATLFTKTFLSWATVNPDTRRPAFGARAVKAVYRSRLAEAVAWTAREMRGLPCLLGEFGLPFDLNGRKAYRTGNYGAQEAAATNYYEAVDSLMLHSTIWHYSADNTQERGDNWNEEDLSIWSLTGAVEGESDSGARGIAGWRRPYPVATAGIPISFGWDRRAHRFRFAYHADPTLGAVTEIYVPPDCFESGLIVRVRADDAPEKEIKATLKPELNRVFVHAEGLSGVVKVAIDARRS